VCGVRLPGMWEAEICSGCSYAGGCGKDGFFKRVIGERCERGGGTTYASTCWLLKREVDTATKSKGMRLEEGPRLKRDASLK